jgi:uridine kinase
LFVDWKILAIDGLSAAGKSTLARQFQRDLPELAVVSLDDFFLPAGRRRASVYARHYDLDRLQMQVLEPFLAGTDVCYQPFDWAKMENSEDLVRIPKTSKLVIEGTYSLDIQLRHWYDFSIWVDTPDSVRVTRHLDRGMSYEEAVEQDGLEELTYTAAFEPKEYATLVLMGATAFPSTTDILQRVPLSLGE